MQVEEEAFQKNLTIEARKSFEMADDLVSTVKIELIFNDSISVFKLEDNFTPNTYEERLAVTKAGLTVPRYMNLTENKSFYNNNGNPIMGEKEFLVYSDLDFKWNILTEEKKINNFTAIKAIGTANKNDKIVKVIAWFAPELPYSHGPYGIGNLPGIILEMQIGNIHYMAKEILIKNSVKTIEIPKKGKLILSEDYYKLQKERFEDFEKGF
jgi:GLPGLI family protein